MNRATGQETGQPGKIDTGQGFITGQNENIGQPGIKTRLPFFVSSECNRAGNRKPTPGKDSRSTPGRVHHWARSTPGKDSSLGKDGQRQPGRVQPGKVGQRTPGKVSKKYPPKLTVLTYVLTKLTVRHRNSFRQPGKVQPETKKPGKGSIKNQKPGKGSIDATGQGFNR